jgi:23S rRNA G2445 N2-methylase RlmL
LLFNPPFGKRVAPGDRTAALYREIHALLEGRWRRWAAAVISTSPLLDELLGPRLTGAIPFRHGGLRCRLLRLAPLRAS